MSKVKPLVFVGVFLALAFLLVYALRHKLVKRAFNIASARIEKKYHTKLTAAAIHVSGYNTVIIAGLALQPENADTLIIIKSAELKLSIAALFKGHIRFNAAKLSDIDVTVYNTCERNNLGFFKDTTGKNSKADTLMATDYRAKAGRVQEKLSQLLNTALDIKDLRIGYRDSSETESIYVPAIKYDLKTLTGLIINCQNPDTFQISALRKQTSEEFEFNIQHITNSISYLPFLNAEKGFKCRFQSIAGAYHLKNVDDELQTSFNISATGLHINHWRLAKEDVVIPQAQLKGVLHLRNKEVQLDSASSLILNHTSFQLFADISHDTSNIFSLAIHMPETVADTFFNALPSGAFNTLNGISCSGTLAYYLQFQLNTAQPDSLIFASFLTRKNLHINHYGQENYERVNAPFIYNACNGDQLLRKIEIGPANPLFTPLQRINPLLVKCVLQSEDPSFMQHRGFLPESFRESIAQDYREKRFARGGSTISMQVVKNVFLSRDKTISRKAQEALIVYLIENLGLISKERMLEIYLNVIEWAPNVYGIGEAARFYFNKSAAELNLQQCLFLAAIIPNPKYFRYQFDKDGHVKKYMADYFKLLANRLATRNLISGKEFDDLVPDVKITGPAAQFITPTDSIPAPDELLPME